MGCNSTKSVVVVVDIRPQSEELRQSPVGQKNPESKYEPFTEYPTYTLLAKAQQEYAARGQPKPDVDSNGMPGLFPTPTSKATIFNRERSRNIDQHARNADKKLATGSYFDIVSYLTAPAEKDVDKVRAIFVWIASQSLGLVLESIKSIGTPENGTPLFWLSTILIKCNAIGYYYLFSELCSAANIPCRTVDNIIVKGAHYEVGDEDLGPSNKLSLVYVDGTWRIVDQFWGSQALSMVADANWVAIAGENGGNKHENSTERVIYQQNDFYFLTDPEMYIYEHWPQNPDEQLLARPVTKTEFLTMAYLRQEFFAYGLTTISHPKCKIEVKADERSSVKILIGLPSADVSIPKLEYVLYKSRYNDEYNLVNGFLFKDFVFVEYIKSQSVMQFTVNLPKYGRYKLDIGQRGSPFYAYCEYLILNEKPRYFEPYPRISNSLVTYGPTVESRQTYGIHPAVDEGAVIEAMEGMVELEFISTWKTSIKHRLLRIETTALSTTDNVEEIETAGRICYYRSEQQFMVIVKFEIYGRYILEVESRDESASLFRYLISSDRGCADMTPFPVGNVSDDGAFGSASSSADNYCVKPVSHARPMFTWDYKDGGSSELAVEMSIVRGGNYLAELFHCAAGKEIKPRELHEYVHCEQVESKLVVFVRFTRHGMHKLNIVVGTNVVYQYLIIVGRVAAEAVSPFPTFNKPIWKNDFVLHEPRTRNVLQGTEVQFKLRITRRADKVTVIQSSSQMVLDCSVADGCMWEGKVQIESGNGVLDIVSIFSDDSSQETLVQFESLSADDMNSLKQQQVKRADEAQNHADDCEQRKIDEADEMDQRKAEYDKQVQEVEDDYMKWDEDEFNRQIELDKKIVKEDRERKTKQIKENDEELLIKEVDHDFGPEIMRAARARNYKKTAPKRKPEEEDDWKRSILLVLYTADQISNASRIRGESWNENYTLRIVVYPSSAQLQPPSGAVAVDRTVSHHNSVSNSSYSGVQYSLALQRLRDPVQHYDADRLQEIINECRRLNMEEYEVSEAESILRRLILKRDLHRACKAKDTKLIERTLASISEQQLDKDLKAEIREAEKKLRELTPRPENDEVTSLSETFKALRRLNQPSSKSVHMLIQTFLLLFGIDEFETQEWNSCRRFLTTNGPRNMVQQVMELTPERINAEIYARCMEMLDMINEDEINESNDDARFIYAWTKEQVEAAASVCEKSAPADINRQRALYLKSPIPDRLLPGEQL